MRKEQEFTVRCMNEPSEEALERWYRTCIKAAQLAARKKAEKEAMDNAEETDKNVR